MSAKRWPAAAKAPVCIVLSLGAEPAVADTPYANTGMSEPRGRLAQCSVGLHAVLAAIALGPIARRSTRGYVLQAAAAWQPITSCTSSTAIPTSRMRVRVLSRDLYRDSHHLLTFLLLLSLFSAHICTSFSLLASCLSLFASCFLPSQQTERHFRLLPINKVQQDHPAQHRVLGLW